MKKIINLFTDLFENSEVTNNRLAAFGANCYLRLTTNNPGNVFDALLGPTKTAVNDMTKALEEAGADIGNRKGKTLTKNEARHNFNEFIRQKEGLIKSTFGEKSEPYIQFFPNGLTAFGRATDFVYAQLVDNILARATQYETELGAAFKNSVASLADEYNSAESEQETEKGQVSGAKDNVADKRTALTRQLTINALTIALQFPFDESKVAVYFDTSLLLAQKRKRIYKGEPAAGATQKVAVITYEAGKSIKMKNTGAAMLRFQMHLQGNPVGEVFTLENGKTLNKKMSDFYTNADALYVTNTGTVIGKYQVDEVA